MNNEVIISPGTTILSALKRMDNIKRKLLIILDNEYFSGLISIGDIQRAIIHQKPLDLPVKEIKRSIIKVASTSDSVEEIKSAMLEMRAEFMPVIDAEGHLNNIIFWEDIISPHISKQKTKISLPVVIMAGGEGTRLKPLTNVIPKPLIPVTNKTIIEEIIDNFMQYNCTDFYISVNYRAEFIKFYLNQIPDKKFNINYLNEERPLGTIGSLHLLKNKISQTFFVTNCDILVDEDYSEILNYHRENNNELTIVAALKSYSIPYGTIETMSNGILDSITEKPEITFKINTGFYIFEPHLIHEIPDNTFFHITSLINNLKNSNRKIGVFPVSEKSWKDIGEWKEYLRFINE